MLPSLLPIENIPFWFPTYHPVPLGQVPPWEPGSLGSRLEARVASRLPKQRRDAFQRTLFRNKDRVPESVGTLLNDTFTDTSLTRTADH